MDVLLESPWPAIGIGLLIEVVLAVVFFNTRNSKVLVAMAAVSLVVILLVLVEWLVVTDREAVADTLEAVARTLETNDVPAVLDYLAPDATSIRLAAQTLLPQVHITEANVGGDLKITINRLTPQPTARAEFTGRIDAKSRSPGDAMPYDTYVRPFVVELEKHDDRWLLTGYQTGQFRAGDN